MKELTIEEKAKSFNEALSRAKGFYKRFPEHKDILEKIFPELKESEGERIWIINYLSNRILNSTIIAEKENLKKAIAWLKNQGEQKPCMIQWKGDNLKEIIDFTGRDKDFDKWFKSFEEYEKYVHDHNGIFKLFNTDGTHYEIPVGSWIVKTPDGCNVASKAKYKQKTAWSEEDEEALEVAIIALEDMYSEDSPLDCYAGHHMPFDKAANQLKSLKERVQPMQEWSEEDRKIIIELIGIFESAIDGGYVDIPYRLLKDYIRVLKSCLPQTAWKPSEEMLEALYRVIPENVMEKSEDEMLLDKLYQGLKYGKVLSEK
jgi:hypothetical protein